MTPWTPRDLCLWSLEPTPSILTLLHSFATLPVTTSTTERSFSALKYIKNYLRYTMNENRLNGFAYLYINRDIELDYPDVIDVRRVI